MHHHIKLSQAEELKVLHKVLPTHKAQFAHSTSFFKVGCGKNYCICNAM
jgi:hypothetical protein